MAHVPVQAVFQDWESQCMETEQLDFSIFLTSSLIRLCLLLYAHWICMPDSMSQLYDVSIHY